MNTHTLGEPRFASTLSHTISDDVRIPERIEIGAEPGIKFELAAMHEAGCFHFTLDRRHDRLCFHRPVQLEELTKGALLKGGSNVNVT